MEIGIVSDAIADKEQAYTDQIESGTAEASKKMDPDSITIADIKKFEALMKGRAVAAVSNS